jgi:hypothetical protein
MPAGGLNAHAQIHVSTVAVMRPEIVFVAGAIPPAGYRKGVAGQRGHWKGADDGMGVAQSRKPPIVDPRMWSQIWLSRF